MDNEPMFDEGSIYSGDEEYRWYFDIPEEIEMDEMIFVWGIS